MGRASIPKYVTLKTVIQGWIDEGQLHPGDQIPTEMELAERFGMSRQTVRMAMNELVYEQVLVRQQGRGTFVANHIHSPRPTRRMEAATAAPGVGGRDLAALFKGDLSLSLTRTVAVVTTYLSDYIFPSIIKGIEARLSDAGFSLMLFNTDNSFEKEAWVLDTLLDRSVDGVIVEPARSAEPNPNLDRYLKLLGHGLPTVTLHSELLELLAPCVRMDDEEGGRLAVEHLAQMGHVRIGVIMKSDDMQGRLRCRGFLKGMRNMGIPLEADDALFFNTDNRDAVAEQYVLRWCERAPSQRPTAIVCYNDEVAMMLKQHLANRGLSIPDDVSLVSFDDSDFAKMGDITSVQHPKYDMGHTVADMVLAIIAAKVDKASLFSQSDYVFPATLAIRNSSNLPKNICTNL